MEAMPKLLMETLQATTDRTYVHRLGRRSNSSSATQTITVQDTTAPEFTFVPADSG